MFLLDAEDSADSPVDIKENIKLKYLVEMPQDFYDFWDFLKLLNATHPEGKFFYTIFNCSHFLFLNKINSLLE